MLSNILMKLEKNTERKYSMQVTCKEINKENIISK